MVPILKSGPVGPLEGAAVEPPQAARARAPAVVTPIFRKSRLGSSSPRRARRSRSTSPLIVLSPCFKHEVLRRILRRKTALVQYVSRLCAAAAAPCRPTVTYSPVRGEQGPLGGTLHSALPPGDAGCSTTWSGRRTATPTPAPPRPPSLGRRSGRDDGRGNRLSTPIRADRRSARAVRCS